MATIPCAEEHCIHQKDGYCYLDTVSAKKMNEASSSCLYFASKATASEALQDNATQNQ